MKNLLIIVGAVLIGWLTYTHPTTQRVSKCMKSDAIVINTDDVIDEVGDHAKEKLKVFLDNLE